MKYNLFVICLIINFSITAQTTVSGIVTDSKNNIIFGASVYLEGTYDGTSTDEKGFFSFKTEEKKIQTIIVSFISFETRSYFDRSS